MITSGLSHPWSGRKWEVLSISISISIIVHYSQVPVAGGQYLPISLYFTIYDHDHDYDHEHYLIIVQSDKWYAREV